MLNLLFIPPLRTQMEPLGCIAECDQTNAMETSQESSEITGCVCELCLYMPTSKGVEIQSPISQIYRDSLCESTTVPRFFVEELLLHHWAWKGDVTLGPKPGYLPLERLLSLLAHEKQSEPVFSFYTLKPQGGMVKQVRFYTHVCGSQQVAESDNPLFSYFSSSFCSR